MQDEFQASQPTHATFGTVYSFPSSARGTAVLPSGRIQAVPATVRYRYVKRALDILLVLLSAPVVLPILAIVSGLVLMTSPGPIFYSHRRIRKNGAFFSMWKFRTMAVNSTEILDQYLSKNPRARQEWKQTHKLKHDPRITPVGRFLRRYSLDELPQVLNVLRGQMTLVGPRPIVAAEVEKYGAGFHFYCSVKPGLTGLWQVSGRSELSYPQRVQLDCDYVTRWSLRRDFVILLRTFLSVANQDGAY
jgi:lipopolysaccharide/colanic/teichoic acid biosynthesis glycosyltransferase